MAETNTTTNLPALPEQVTEIKRLPLLLEKNIPIMQKRKAKAGKDLFHECLQEM